MILIWIWSGFGFDLALILIWICFDLDLTCFDLDLAWSGLDLLWFCLDIAALQTLGFLGAPRILLWCYWASTKNLLRFYEETGALGPNPNQAKSTQNLNQVKSESNPNQNQKLNRILVEILGNPNRIDPRSLKSRDPTWEIPINPRTSAVPSLPRGLLGATSGYEATRLLAPEPPAPPEFQPPPPWPEEGRRPRN